MFDPMKGPARKPLGGDELKAIEKSGGLVRSALRRRPLYFDGRFLAAKDLTREQDYFLARQADLARAGGFGVVFGLDVTRGATARSTSTIDIAPGHGVTPSGEIVLVSERLSVDLASIAELQRLDAKLGLLQVPHESGRNRTGLFVVALRPVEWTANPIASYPTSIDAKRSVEDGDIIEGVVVTLIPFPNASRAEPDWQRAHAAREIFVDRASRGQVADALPLAMVSLDRGTLRWVDPFLVRREVGFEHKDVLGVARAPQALREAHLVQYDQHLADIVDQRKHASLEGRFAAAEHFLALPPAGRLPAGVIDARDFTQIFFPPEIDVDLSIAPEDEIAALIDESHLLPPIDLTLEGDEQASTSVLVLIPAPRASLRRLTKTLGTLTRTLRPAPAGLVARRTPLEAIRTLSLRLPSRIVTRTPVVDAAEQAWRTALSEAGPLWYVRRRNLHFKAEVVGSTVDLRGDERALEKGTTDRLGVLGLGERLGALTTRATAQGRGEVLGLLGSEKFKVGLLAAGAIEELTARPVVDRVAVLAIDQRYARKNLGEGVARIATEMESLEAPTKVTLLARAGIVPELDEVLASTGDASDRRALLTEIDELATQGRPDDIAKLVRESLAAVRAGGPR